MKVSRYQVSLKQVPVDFFADPDGLWDFESLAEAAGFDPDQGVAVGALTGDFRGHPAGAAVVTLNAKRRPYVAIIECPVHRVAGSDETYEGLGCVTETDDLGALAAEMLRASVSAA